MAKKKTTQKKKKVFLFILIFILLICLSLGLLFVYFEIKNNGTNNPSSSHDSTQENSSSHDSTPSEIISDELTIKFLTLGNKLTGDSTYIKAGDVDILIDAGSRTSSTDTLINHIDEYCTDGKLEYVIATHAHQDHIACFATYDNDGIFDTYEIGTLIDFSFANTTSKTYKNYIAKRDQMVKNGEMIHHTADYYFSDNEPNENNHIQLTDTITMDVLYNPYYFTKTSDENDYSVSVMINQGENHFMFTGDLEKSGEEGMASYYEKRGGLPHVKVFKGGHHGSKTSSNEVLLKQITPEICCVCCCAGSNEYTDNTYNQFPTQDFINRIAKYTTNVFVTTTIKYDSKGYQTDEFEDLNGVITVHSDSTGKVKVKGSNNTVKLKDSEWFNRKIMHQRHTSSGPVDNGLHLCRTWPNTTSMYNDVEIME